MNAMEPIVMLTAAAGSFAFALLLQWLTLRALFYALPGRRKVSAAQVAVMRTRRVLLPCSGRSRVLGIDRPA